MLNLETNLAWKLTPRLYLEAGFSHFRSLGRNRYDEVTLNFADQPVPPTSPYLRRHAHWYAAAAWSWLAQRRGWAS